MVCYYILNDKKELVVVDLHTWGSWCEKIENRQVACTHINEYLISTVFLGIDHSFKDLGKPLIYETMVFGPRGDESYMARYHSWQEAQIGHNVACEWVKQGGEATSNENANG